MQSDTLLLAGVFENFREILKYMSWILQIFFSPGLESEVALEKTKVKLDY